MTTNAATAIGNVTAQLNGPANPNGDAATGWFRLRHDQPGDLQRHVRHAAFRPSAARRSASGSGAVAVPRSRRPGCRRTTYYFCAIAPNSLGHVVRRGAVVHDVRAGAVTTSAATAITSTTASAERLGQPERRVGDRLVPLHTTDPGTCNDTFGTRVSASAGANLGSGRTAVSYAFNTNTAIALHAGDDVLLLRHRRTTRTARRSARC